MNRIKSQREWTEREIAELKTMRADGVPYAVIALHLDRTFAAIATAVSKFNANNVKRPWRLCDIRRVRELAARGYSDRIIGLNLGRSRSAVSQVREREGIPCGRVNRIEWKPA